MIALAAHEEEGPGKGLGGGLRPHPGPAAPEGQPPGEIGRDCGSERYGPGGACGARPPWAFLEEFRLGLLSARAHPSDLEALPAH